MMRRLLPVGLCFLASAGFCLADDLFQPGWRGQPGTTYQQWTFDDDDNPATPEVDDNPFGTATATMAGLNLDWQSGAWNWLDTLDLWIPNQPESDIYKKIWLQVTYVADYGPIMRAPPESVEAPGATLLYSDDVLLSNPGLTQTRLLHMRWLIAPNPSEETIHLIWYPEYSHPYGYVEQIVVDTICAPEPASVTLLMLGALPILVKRRRSG